MTGHNPAHRADAPPPDAASSRPDRPAPAAAPKGFELPSRHAAVWVRVDDHVAKMLAKPELWLLDDEDRLKDLRNLTVGVGKAVTHGEPASRDELERLAAAAIHWALELPDHHPEDQP